MPTSLTATANPLIASDKVVGTSVFDATSTQIGEIQKLMINKLTGKVAYAILTFGGGSWGLGQVITRCPGKL